MKLWKREPQGIVALSRESIYVARAQISRRHGRDKALETYNNILQLQIVTFSSKTTSDYIFLSKAYS